MFQKFVFLAVAGAMGALARYGLAGAVHRWLGSSFPWGTAVVNFVGCLLFGLVWATAVERGSIGPEMRTVVLVGFVGSFTTFSTFVSETSQLFSGAQLFLGFANIVLQVTIGIAMFFLGLFLGRVI